MKIHNKLFLILFSFSLILVIMLVVLMQWSIAKGMVDYVNTKEVEALKPVITELAQIYKEDHGWQAMTGSHPRFRQLIETQLQGDEFAPRRHNFPPPRRPLRDRPPKDGPHALHKGPKDKHPAGRLPPPEHEARYALLDENDGLVVGKYLDNLKYSKTPIVLDGVTVGYFAVSKRERLTQGYEVEFIEQQQQYLWLIALLAIALVLLITRPLARHLVEPIKVITRGMHKLTQGDYQHTVDLKRQDEFGQLSRDYNELAIILAANDSARKRWLANISHELRTPVAILRGELEAMIDEVRPLTMDNVGSAHDEVKHLQRLIEDLHLLTSADIGAMHYRKQEEELTQVLANELDKYRSYLASAGITLNIEPTIESKASQHPILIYADTTRLYQLFENIINNAVKYSSATVLTLSVKQEISSSNIVLITFEDNGVGVEEKHLAHLFEHLYRVDDSRNRQTGGSGLGLSICRHIVAAHQGEIWAEKSSLGGLAIHIRLKII
ncbi:ATP-binding region, ATPase-like protein [Shewanella denitrificans OS217]|jgi:two-component system, OmpR family, sensor histidine kinase BaeS|uniref:histidine kinase n=2 Tax=Shewanella TaxID=22 RepID=Q12SP4_SHEDO|nr:ATP-binding protein [Shewanella denitrificans]ABE53532.1 ATP-binding region, ATPase-like protein [Shewanella denitrificans OS217]